MELGRPIPGGNPFVSKRRSRATRGALIGLFIAGFWKSSVAAALAWIVPGVANLIGVSSADYQSAVVLTNPGIFPLTVTVSLIPAPDTLRVAPRVYTIAPGSSVLADLETTWHVGGTGALRIEADARVDIFARTYRLFVTVLPLYGGTALPVIEE